MKKKTFFITIMWLFMLIFSIPVYAVNGNTAKDIKLNKSTITMYVTENATIKAVSSKGKLEKVIWKSSNTRIATVRNGVVTAKKTGTVTITASSNGMKKTCRVVVKGDWYRKVLESSNAVYKVKRRSDGKIITVYRKNYDNYRLIDLNKDGVKELILYKQPEGIVFFTYYKGKVTPLIYDYWLRGVYLKGNYLTIQQGTSSENTCRVYILKNGKFKQIGEYFHTTSSAYPVPVYKINGKSCSKETFFKTYNKYMKNINDLI